MQRYSLLIVGLVLVLMSVVSAGELKVCLDGSLKIDGTIPVAPPPAAPGNDEATYSGTVRVYLVEPMARWTDQNGDFYHYGFLDFGVVSSFDLPDGQTLYRTGTWDATTTTIGEIFPENLMAIGVVARAQTVLTDANPPEGYYFMARYTDAAAASTPGVVGHSQATSPYTHKIFIEEATANW
jgi:hypothetical protein